ncbi:MULTISPECIES: hypothetical protein [unclassified Ketobacter]|uniref:hypothetical protein n=1 Tax=unclassified Ketobacter TaxID=2639109 RepID=UPI0025BA7AB6|nr:MULTISPECIES: hypothetical protein [unclassified Ketobacter]
MSGFSVKGVHPIVPGLACTVLVIGIVYGLRVQQTVVQLQQQSVNLSAQIAGYQSRIVNLETELALLSQRIARADARQSPLQAELAANTAVNTTTNTHAAMSEATMDQASDLYSALPLNDEIAEHSNALELQAIRDQASQRYYQDFRDERWAEEQEANVLELLSQAEHFSGVSLDYLDCRSETCLLELRVSQERSKHAEVMLAGVLGKELPHAVWERDGDKLILQLSR